MGNKKILLVFTLLLSASISIQIAFAGDLNMKTCFAYNRNNSFSLKNFEIYVGKISPECEPETSKYVLKIFDDSNNILFTKRLVISFFNPITNTIQETGETCYELPYNKQVSKLKIFYDNKEIFSADLKNYICNKNSVCDLGENQYNCPEDCEAKKGVSTWFYIFILVAAISTIALLVILKFKPKSQTYSSLYQKWK